MQEEPQLPIQWRGQHYGPWTYAEIQSRLQEGEIHSMYQIHTDGVWITLREYIEKIEAVELQRRAVALAASIRQRQAEAVTPIRNASRGRIQTTTKRPNPFANPPPTYIKGATQTTQTPYNDPNQDRAATCWLAVAAFVVSCCSFVPYLNLVSWLPSLVLGHWALGQIRRDPVLEGRGLAISALFISYATLIFAVLSWLVYPDLFYRIFPIAD